MNDTELERQNCDNFEVEVTARGINMLRQVIRILLARNSSMVGYDIGIDEKSSELIFHWGIPKPDYAPGVVAFPFSMKEDEIVAFIAGWLRDVAYGREPDIDGSCSKGWHISTKCDGGWRMAAFSVRPEWVMHHK